MHIKHAERVILAIAVVFVAVIGIVVYSVAPKSPSIVGGEQNTLTESQVNPPKNINVPIGWKEYRDEGLGYGFAYPSDWELSLESLDKTIQQERVEQIVLLKNNIKILIDPLGRRGGDEFSSPIKIEREVLNGISWQHIYWPPKVYHRFTDDYGSLLLKNDSSTIGVVNIGGRNTSYNKRSNFRVHVYIGETLEEERQEILNVIRKMLETLTLI